MRQDRYRFKTPGGSDYWLRDPSERAPDIQKVIDKDRAWFARRPHRRYRARFATPAELSDAETRGVALIRPETAAVITLVKNLGAAGQHRFTVGALEIRQHPKTFGDAECRALIAEMWRVME